MSRLPFVALAFALGVNAWSTPVFAEPNRALPAQIVRLRPADDSATGRKSTLDLPDQGTRNISETPISGLPSIGAVVASLCFVLGLFFFLAWILRKGMPRSASFLPAEVAEPLGRVSLAPRHDAQLLRIGNKLLLVAISPAGAEPLVEITDPMEVDRLIGICKQSQPGSSTSTFRQVFQQFAAQKVPRGFLGKSGQSNRELANVEPIPASESHA